MEERNQECNRGTCGGERSHLVVRYQLKERTVAVTETEDEGRGGEWRGRPKRYK